MAEEAYYLDGSRNQQGPVPVAEIGRLIRDGTIRRDTLIWYAGMPDWRPASGRALGGTAGIAGTASTAAVETSLPA